MKTKFICPSFCFILSMLLFHTGFGQVHDHSHHNEGFEIGGSGAMVYHIDEKEFTPGFHIHAVKILSERFGAGIGYEGITGEAYHQTVTVFGKIFLADFLSLAVGPGILLPNSENQEFNLIGHIETITEFELGKIHIGPFAGYGFGKHGSHLSIGLHAGIHF
ncbi:MAG: hypothetical protein JW798_15005 [Prolixibacteraceae bacterium]|nr:hypothetical protein [Prolixibacteraceae bacterium]